MTHGRRGLAAALAVSVSAAIGAGAASAKPIVLPNVVKQVQRQHSLIAAASTGIYPKAPPCPENGILPGLFGGISVAGLGVPVGNCGISETPATTLPFLGDMAYWGGKVQVHPKEYIVYWGWDQPGAWTVKDSSGKSTPWPGTTPTCPSSTFSEGALPAVTLSCDPDGAGKYMADFVQQMANTNWAKVQDQYFQVDKGGKQEYIDESGNMLAGMWVDNSVPANFESTKYTNPAGSTNTFTLFGREASAAVQHFEQTGQLDPADITNANIILAQPPGLTDPNALSLGYCAFHDFTEPATPGNGYYNDPQVTRHIAYTNMPYTLAIDIGGSNVCGADAVNAAPRGNLDTFSLALGHEIQETATDPGAEDVVGNITTGGETYYGGWYDALDANENGDKCAYVGTPPNAILGLPNAPGEPRELPVPGAMGNIKGNAGEQFAVQSLWSNAAAGGAGYCAGVPSSDLPGPLAGEPPYAKATLLGLSRKAIASGKKARRAHTRQWRQAHHAKAKAGARG